MRQSLAMSVLCILLTSEVSAAGKMYSASLDTHCTSWNLNRLLGKKSTCRSRAKLLSQSELECRLKKTAPNKNDPNLTDCIYERAGYGLGTTTVSLEDNGVCPRTIQCKRN